VPFAITSRWFACSYFWINLCACSECCFFKGRLPIITGIFKVICFTTNTLCVISVGLCYAIFVIVALTRTASNVVRIIGLLPCTRYWVSTIQSTYFFCGTCQITSPAVSVRAIPTIVLKTTFVTTNTLCVISVGLCYAIWCGGRTIII